CESLRYTTKPGAQRQEMEDYW
nr:immunoglobulin heavy chain junction region [Macaca mulatta]MOX95994.1 immunoglobulin heavy chain junction region [Macaca mulatta]MOX96081.1 immunoglobulin heavy chain junction region [Macaca mulatta]MOX96638.1 immunoglobulin heavy chain junction region [Macaca mulatta]